MMEDNKVHIPKGWTYLSHGTNSTEWDQDLSTSDSFVTKGDLSCVDIENLLKELESGSNSVNNYALREGEPFEIRCLIYKDCVRHVDKDGLKQRLTKEEIKDIYKYYSSFFGRHECVPRNTKLIKIATSEKNELTGEDRKVYWFVPEKYYEHYKEDIEKYPDRVVELATSEASKEQEQLPSWDLRNWNLTPEEVQEKKPEMMNIEDALKEYNQDAFDVQNVSQINDSLIKRSLLEHYGMNPDSKIDVFLAELEDNETGENGYCLYMRDKNGKLKELKLPISKENSEVTVDSKLQAVRMEDNKKIYSPGKKTEGLVSWKLYDGMELTVFKTDGDQIKLGKTDQYGREGFIETVNSKNMKDKNELDKNDMQETR